MKNSTSIVLLALAVVLGAFVVFFEKDTLGTREQITLPPFAFEPAEARLISISRGGENFTLRNDDGRWLISLPFEDRANQEICRELLATLTEVTILETIATSEFSKRDITLEEIELAPGAGTTITVFGGEGPLAALRIGRPGFLEESTYAIFPESDRFPEVYVLDSNLADLAIRTLAALRDPVLFRLAVEEVGRVLLSDGRGDFLEIYRDPRTTMWRLAQPFAARADQEAVKNFVDEICSLEVEEFIDPAEGPPFPADSSAGSISLWPVPAGFASLVPLPEVSRDAEHRVELDFTVSGPVIDSEKSPLLGKLSGRDSVVRLPDRVAILFKTDPASLRDRFLAQIPDRSVRGVVISSPGAPDVMLSSNGKTWSSLRNGEWEAADSLAVERLLEALNEEEILEHIAPAGAGSLEPYGLDPPSTRIGLTTSTVGAATELEDPSSPINPNEELLEAHSLSYVLGLSAVREDEKSGIRRVYAKFAGEPWLMAINPAFLAAVPDHPLKWKSRGVLSFNIVSLREIRLRGADPKSPVTRFLYDFATSDWSFFVDDEEQTELLNPRVARSLADTLGSLKARDWLSNRETGLRALEKPALTVEVVLSYLSDDGSHEIKKTATIVFASVAGPGAEEDRLYFGRLDDSPEVFLVDRAIVESLRTSPLRAAGAASRFPPLEE